MKLGTFIAMLHDKLSDDEEIAEINAYFDPAVPATEYQVEVWPARGDRVLGRDPKWVQVKKKPRVS